MGQTGTTLELDQAVVTADQVLRDRKTEPRAVGASGHERIEQRVAQMVGHARTVVFELHARDEPMAARADVDVGQRARAQHDAALAARVLRDRLQRVATEVEHRLDDEIAIERAAAAGSDRSRDRPSRPAAHRQRAGDRTCCSSS